jgi:hypothetical protein
MAGSLPRLGVRPPEDIEVIDKKMDVYQTALNSLTQQGIRLPELPSSGYRGEMPKDLSALDDEELGNLLNETSIWCGYMDAQYSMAMSQHRQSEEILTSTRAYSRIALKADEDGRKLTVQDKDDRVENDPLVVQRRSEELYYFTRFTLIKNMRDTAQKNWETVSRRITIRGQEVERMRRGDNVANTPLRATRAFRRS